jgi:hypothetical protein
MPGRVAAQRLTALSPCCAQLRAVSAQVIHRFMHKSLPSWEGCHPLAGFQHGQVADREPVRSELRLCRFIGPGGSRVGRIVGRCHGLHGSADPGRSASGNAGTSWLKKPAAAALDRARTCSRPPVDGLHLSGLAHSSSRSEEHGRRASWPVGRVLCTRLRGPTAIHLGLPLPTASCGLPASSGGPPSNARAGPAAETAGPFRPCSGWGLPSRPDHSGRWWSLTPPFHPYPWLGQGRSAFCGTVPRVTPGRRYRSPCPAEPGPSSPGLPGAAARPARPPQHPA